MRALVTGGGGFLGTAIVKRLHQRGDSVRSFARSHYPHLEPLSVEQFLGDLADRDAVIKAAADRDIVFHVAAKAGVWGRYADYHRVNVTGTENVLAACRASGIRKLVYTSSPSVVYTGCDEEGIDESTPYAHRFLAHYPHTKALAEKMVLAVNGANLATVALRPHLIWGPGDPHLMPRLVARARASKLRQIGAGRNMVDATYVDNAADAHLLAADRLDVGAPIAGKAYFVAQGEPLSMWDFINRMLATAEVPPVTRRVSARSAYVLGTLLEMVYVLMRLPDEPPMTRFVARQLSTSHWYDLSAIKRDLGYMPQVAVAEGLRRLRESFSRTASDSSKMNQDFA